MTDIARMSAMTTNTVVSAKPVLSKNANDIAGMRPLD
jgi:hypothetical protein